MLNTNMDQKIRIAVSGVGGGVGQSIIKALADTKYEVIALDGEPLGTGLYAAGTSYTIPYANDPTFVDCIIEICKQEACKLFFPGLDAELAVLSKNVELFREAGIQLIVSSPEVVALSDDKLLTYTELTRHGALVPLTVDMADHLENGTALPPFPFILKRRIGGARSKDVHLLKGEDELARLVEGGIDLKAFIAQEYIGGDEYTCGSINFNGECKGVIVMRRTLRDGDTYKCFSVKDKMIEAEVKKIVNGIKPFGGCNIQLRVKDGKPYVFEINARCSGTTAARALCGFNEPRMIADFLLEGKEPKYEIKEQTILRYWKELVVDNESVEQVQKDGTLSQTDYTRL